jgi:hypothetical protein
MPRFVIERTFPDGLKIPTTPDGAKACMSVVAKNGSEGVTWIHSYVSEDLRKTWCVYDAPSADAIREVARRNNLPVDHMAPVRVLDPYFYHS